MAEKPEHVLLAEYIAAIGWRMDCEKELKAFLISVGPRMTDQQLAKWQALLEADRHAKDALAKARDAYVNWGKDA